MEGHLEYEGGGVFRHCHGKHYQGITVGSKELHVGHVLTLPAPTTLVHHLSLYLLCQNAVRSLSLHLPAQSLAHHLPDSYSRHLALQQPFDLQTIVHDCIWPYWGGRGVYKRGAHHPLPPQFLYISPLKHYNLSINHYSKIKIWPVILCNFFIHHTIQHETRKTVADLYYKAIIAAILTVKVLSFILISLLR